MDQYTNYLAHHGVLGMKWGVRRYQNKDGSLTSAGERRYNAKEDLKKAKKEFKAAKKEVRKKSWTAVGIKGIQGYEKSASQYKDKEYNLERAKAKYKASKKSSLSKANKAEFNYMAKSMGKSGIRGSALDTQMNGRTSYMYAKLKAEKGKSYADAVEKRVQNVAIAKIATGATIMVGANAVALYLDMKR